MHVNTSVSWQLIFYLLRAIQLVSIHLKWKKKMLLIGILSDMQVLTYQKLFFLVH